MQSLYQVFRDLAEYVKEYFPNGIPWNPKGQPVKEVIKSLDSGSASSSTPAPPPPPGAGGPPPPPPPGPPPVLKIKEQAAAPEAPAAGGLGAVFSELNKGESVTKGLRKVDKSEMTHKNPSLRAGSTVPDGESSVRGKSPAPGKKPKPESMRVKKPPKKELDGNKWTIVCVPLLLFPAPLLLSSIMLILFSSRKTTRKSPNQSKSTPRSTTPSSSANAATPPS